MTASRIHLALAASMGAAGVALWAMAAHRPATGLSDSAALVTASQFMLFHASAILAITSCRKQGLLSNSIASIAVAMLILGVVLFAGDIMMRSFAGQRLFAMAAPVAGSLTILGWLGVALAAIQGNDPNHP